MTRHPLSPWQEPYAEMCEHQETIASAIDARDDETLMNLDGKTQELLQYMRLVAEEMDRTAFSPPSDRHNLAMVVSILEPMISRAQTVVEKNMAGLRIWLDDLQKHLANRRLYASPQTGEAIPPMVEKAGPSCVGGLSDRFRTCQTVSLQLGEHVDSES